MGDVELNMSTSDDNSTSSDIMQQPSTSNYFKLLPLNKFTSNNKRRDNAIYKKLLSSDNSDSDTSDEIYGFTAG